MGFFIALRFIQNDKCEILFETKLVEGEKMTEENKMQITEKDRKRMNNKLFQFWRFIVLNLKILKAVDHSKRS